MMTQHPHKSANGQARREASHATTGAADGAAPGRALRRLARAEAAFERSQRKAARLRLKLDRVEAKMTRRAGRIESARATLLGATDMADMPALTVAAPSLPAPAGEVDPPLESKGDPKPAP